MDEVHSQPGLSLGWKKTVLFSLLPVLLLLMGLETAARVAEIWWPPRVVDVGQGFTKESHLFVPSPENPDKMMTNPSRTVSFHPQEFERKKPQGTMRIFALGGSSVNYLDYEFPLLAERLQRALSGRFTRVEIINCGGLSYGSHRLVLIAGEVLGYEPDALIFYEGHNEFEEVEQLDLANLRALPLQRALVHVAMYRFVRDRIAGLRIARLEAEHNRRLLATTIPDTSKSWGHPFTPEEVRQRMEAFRQNLSSIVEMCQSRKVQVVLGTVPSNLVKPNLPGEDGKRYEQVVALFAKGAYEEGTRLGRDILKHASPRHQSSDVENGILREVAAQYKVPLADVEEAVLAAEPHHVPGETLFNDHCHLNPEGNKILSAQYEQRLREAFGLPPR